MEFIGRKYEQKRLKKVIDSNELNTTLIFGRRRVGKSELVKHVLKDYECLKFYYECKEVSEKSNTNALSELISETLKLPKFEFNDFESILKYIFELGKERKVILILDEYPYLKKIVQGIDSIIQSLIDNYKDVSNVSFIILGSYVDIMKSLLLSSNPLYGRIDLTIDLKPMDYYDSSLFYSSFSYEDKVKLYSVFGGIPYYNRLIDSSKSVYENIIDLIASDGARLENEVSMYLNSEISKIVNANEVFLALSKGFSKYSDILSQSHVSSGPTLVDVLDKLIKMNVVIKVNPINSNENNKKSSYYISDNLSLFYYRYIFKYLSQMKIMDSNVFFDKYIKKDFEEQYVPHVFESICKEYLIRKNKEGKFDPILEKIGKYYYDNPKEKLNGEFDVVSLDSKGYIFYEAKFRNISINDSMIEKEIEQVSKTKLNCYKYVFISKSGFECKERDNVELINLEELYE